ncbi:MAG TPA: arginine--tRNA ligase [Acholeplasmataceae bacterium]|nr:arginine--tRNA ligase [Acholeplasmataceae bacterium]
MRLIRNILSAIKEELKKIVSGLGIVVTPPIEIDIPKDPGFGDFSTNLAMRLAKTARKNPRELAAEIVARIDCRKLNLDKAEVAGAGFINFYIDRRYLSQVIFQIFREQENYGTSAIGQGTKVNLEFVSANPTGYLHIGHGRGAAYGDSLARVMRKAGYEVTTEHYVNDAGNQIHNLTLSIHERYKELFGLPCDLGKDGYYGPEIIEIAKLIKAEKGDYYLHNEWYRDIRAFGLNYLLAGLKRDLREFNVTFDVWFSEQSLYDSGEVQKVLDFYRDNGYVYEKDGAVWLKTTERGDEKDRVLIKSDKSLTYITPDIAYHANKLDRGFNYLITVLGADHHGHILPLKIALELLGRDTGNIHVEILQMVRVIQNGAEIKMSKRSGKAITLRDLIDEVGTDALRFMYVEKALGTHIDLDLDLAVKKSNENPVYYVQYAYARICSLFRVHAEQGLTYQPVAEFKALDVEKAKDLLFALAVYPLYVEEAAIKRLPHKIAQYLLLLASGLHSYYNSEKIITDDPLETAEKMTLMDAVRTVLRDGLNLIGVNVKEKM